MTAPRDEWWVLGRVPTERPWVRWFVLFGHVTSQVKAEEMAHDAAKHLYETVVVRKDALPATLMLLNGD